MRRFFNKKSKIYKIMKVSPAILFLGITIYSAHFASMGKEARYKPDEGQVRVNI